ncbi:MAG TPA: hypothetical protein PLM63_01275 [bacterium]|nr:hypothetical protein [bacterium]HPO11197.1 hypothetical protein [bacterium]
MSFKNNNKSKNIEGNKFNVIDFHDIEGGLKEYINNAIFLQDYSIDVFKDFVEIEKYIKVKTPEINNNIKNIKNFLEKNSKNNFYLKNFLEELLNIFNDLSIDSVSLLKNRKIFYSTIFKILESQQKNKHISSKNKGAILKTEVFRYGGDEFIAIITRDIGVELVFFDIMYLNFFNDLFGYKGGDDIIYIASRLIENTLKSFENKATKTRNIVDKILSNFINFQFDREYSYLNKIIFNINIGYSSNSEIEWIKEQFIKYIKDKKIRNINATLSIHDSVNIMIYLAEIRESINKNILKFYLLTSLYNLSKKDSKIDNIFKSYLMYTKSSFLIEDIVKDISKNSKDEEELINNIILESLKIEEGKMANIFNTTNTKYNILLQLIFSKVTDNIPANFREFSIDEVIKKWGLD